MQSRGMRLPFLTFPQRRRTNSQSSNSSKQPANSNNQPRRAGSKASTALGRQAFTGAQADGPTWEVSRSQQLAIALINKVQM